jgi:hypothetical protein
VVVVWMGSQRAPASTNGIAEENGEVKCVSSSRNSVATHKVNFAIQYRLSYRVLSNQVRELVKEKTRVMVNRNGVTVTNGLAFLGLRLTLYDDSM